VVEYSEISEKNSQKTKSDDSDELVFNAGNICNHFFTLDFAKDVCKYERKRKGYIIYFFESFRNHDDELRYHIAKKKVPSIGKDGKRVNKPTQPNGIKLEKFVFDVFPFAKYEHFI
jgi:UDP-N-acetylglucosamine/UDP-N-acetylgalactosamine diphosphorylase